MTTMMMNSSDFASYRGRSIGALIEASSVTRLRHEMISKIDWCVENLLDAAGGVALALVPFSMLSWLFIAY